jgi:hypothetical protein
VLKFLEKGTYKIMMNCGRGANTKGELLALWCLLYFSSYIKVTQLQLVGDSRVIIDWFSNINDLQVIYLVPWINIIRMMRERFIHLKAQHIYRTYNMEVDQLSKEALLLEEDGIYYAVKSEGESENFERLIIN